MADRFYIGDHMACMPVVYEQTDDSFARVCEQVRDIFDQAWKSERLNMEAALRIQKRAIMGYENEVAYFMEKISQIISEIGAEKVKYPAWYRSLAGAVYHELYGLCGLAEWFCDEYMTSSSAKIIGDRIYFMVNGRMELRPQRISDERREQLVRAFLLGSPEERLDSRIHEIYLLDGTRVTVFKGSMTKRGQDAMVFRRYILPVYTFEEQVSRGTIPPESVEVFKRMVKLGYNVAFTGAVRTAKSSFLTTWQSYEDPTLEGVLVETDSELQLHKLSPSAPILQLLADGDELRHIVKNLLRSDADYFIIAEARDGVAVDTAVKIASKGNRRLKITFHEREPCNFCHDAAAEIVKTEGGDFSLAARAVAGSFDYVFNFIQLRDKSKKRLKSIYEVSFDHESGCVRYKPVLLYDIAGDSWQWFSGVSLDKEAAGLDEDVECFCEFNQLLMELGGGDRGECILRAC